MTNTHMRTSEVAQAAGVNQQTLRYYERRGLLEAPDRSPGGHRLYSPEVVTVLKVIKAAQRLGFTLEEVADLIATGRHRHGKRIDPGLQVRARLKLDEIEERISDLEIIKANLQAALDAGCDDITACATTDCCPIPFVALASADGGSRD